MAWPSIASLVICPLFAFYTFKTSVLPHGVAGRLAYRVPGIKHHTCQQDSNKRQSKMHSGILSIGMQGYPNFTRNKKGEVGKTMINIKNQPLKPDPRDTHRMTPYTFNPLRQRGGKRLIPGGKTSKKYSVKVR